MSLIEEQSKKDSITSKKVWLTAKRRQKDSLSLFSLVSNKIAQILSEVESSILPNVNALLNEEQLDIRSFHDSGYRELHAALACILEEESNLIFRNFPRIVNFKIKKSKTLTGHERFFRNQENLLSRPSKDSTVQNCVTSVTEIFKNFLGEKDNWQKENNHGFSDEGTYDYFKQSDLQTIERDTLTKYRQLKNLLKRIVKGVKSKVSSPLVSIFLKRIIPLNLFHTYTTDEDDINRVATNTFGFSIISIYQLGEAVFHSINSKILIKNEIRFGGIN